MGTAKKLRNLLATVNEALGDDLKAKELKKAKALKRFLHKLEKKRAANAAQLEKGGLTDKERKALEKENRILDEQIKKGWSIHEDL